MNLRKLLEFIMLLLKLKLTADQRTDLKKHMAFIALSLPGAVLVG